MTAFEAPEGGFPIVLRGIRSCAQIIMEAIDRGDLRQARDYAEEIVTRVDQSMAK